MGRTICIKCGRDSLEAYCDTCWEKRRRRDKDAEIAALKAEVERLRGIRHQVRIGTTFKAIFEEAMEGRAYWEECVSIMEQEMPYMRRRAKAEALREVLDQLMDDCMTIVRKHMHSKDKAERETAGMASYAQGLIRCRLKRMLKQLEEQG
jgi:hypothetical protein